MLHGSHWTYLSFVIHIYYSRWPRRPWCMPRVSWQAEGNEATLRRPLTCTGESLFSTYDLHKPLNADKRPHLAVFAGSYRVNCNMCLVEYVQEEAMSNKEEKSHS